jgi:uncharacterized protein (DUF488 family)
VTIYTVGFTKKSAEKFFDLLCQSGAKRLVDVRLHNVSQLAGFAKRDDLAFFLRRLCGIEYVAEPLLAPEPALLDGYRAGKIGWGAYAAAYDQLLKERRVESSLDPGLFDGAVLLCSEDLPERCHRRLAAEYLAAAWTPTQVRHLR